MQDFNRSVYQELAQHIFNGVSDFIGQDVEELHFHLFNEDHYIIGHYQASEWLKTHGIDSFEAIDYVQEYEKENFGETHTKINSEAMVNMLVYIVGEEMISDLQSNIEFDDFNEIDDQFVSEVKAYLKSEYKDLV